MVNPRPLQRPAAAQTVAASALSLLVALGLLPSAAAVETTPPPAEGWSAVQPALRSSCYECHGNGKSKGGVDLQRLEKDPAFAAEFELWSKVQATLHSGEMPPDDARKPLADEQRKQLSASLASNLRAVILANAGDPGPVTLRRLSNSEYDCAVRDLTGVDFQSSREFTPDAGGGEGFSNLGDVLFLNPQHLNTYFSAARKLADHAEITPGSGIRFSALRVGPRGPSQLRAGTEAALYRWYQEKSTPYLPTDDEDLREADYMLACWQWKHRATTEAASLRQLATEHGLKPAFLENWWAVLESAEPKSRFLDLTRLPWQALAAPDPANPKAVPAGVKTAIAEIQTQRRAWLQPKKWPVQRAQQDADGLRPYPLETALAGQGVVHLVLGDTGDGNKGDWVFFEGLEIQRAGKFGSYPEWLEGRQKEDSALLARDEAELAAKGLSRAELQKRLGEAGALLSRLGKHPRQLPLDPKALLVQAPLVLTLPMPKDAQIFRAKGRLDLAHPDAEFATAQWLATTAAPPDPTRIIPGVLTVWKRQTQAQRSTMDDFNKMKSVFPDSLERRLEEVAKNFHRGGTGPGVYFLNDTQLRPLLPPAETQRMTRLLEDWRFVRVPNPQPPLLTEWDSALLAHLDAFAARAWRRPLSEVERLNLKQVYQAGIAGELDRESAAREVLVRVLVAPDFLFKLEQNQGLPVHPVSSWELASRLSFMLWSSVPDETLAREAASGALLQAGGLRAAAGRMLRDERAGALAREFAAQWLEFHHFDAHTKVDTGRFPEFTPALRADFHNEAVAFFSHIVRNDRPVREILSARYTFLNGRLSRHYGIAGVEGDAFVQTDVSQHGRGGILGMGALLTKTSYPHRTSPVLRGNWLLQTVLGTRIPPPPNDVPKLDESVASAKSLRERLERHRADKACASCHDKMDPLGFALEAFDPIGRLRTQDEAGIPVDTSAKTRDGQSFEGVGGLRSYLATRDAEFLAVFCRKLLGYSLGRVILPTDQPLLDAMRLRLQKEDGTFSTAVLSIVESRQFTQRRND
jgi:hypothetical protein